MYLKLTTRCNMSCAHCGMNCTSKGKDMTPRVYKKAIEFATDFTDSITLGGGEPTLHKNFWEILGLSIGSAENVWLATNGSQTEIALKLANMARKGIIGCALSQDEYHDPIDPRVIQAFQRDKIKTSYYEERNSNDCREIRDVTGKEIKSGRCEEGEEGCICENLTIEPDGRIRACGCPDAPYFGDIFHSSIPEDWDGYACHKKQEMVEEMA